MLRSEGQRLRQLMWQIESVCVLSGPGLGSMSPHVSSISTREVKSKIDGRTCMSLKCPIMLNDDLPKLQLHFLDLIGLHKQKMCHLPIAALYESMLKSGWFKPDMEEHS